MKKSFLSLFFFLFSLTVQAQLLEGPVHVTYADRVCECGYNPTEDQKGDQGMGMGMRVGDLKLRPGAIIEVPPVEPPPPVIPPDDPPPEEPAPVWTTNIEYFGTEATVSRRQKYEIVREMIERVMNNASEDFKNDVLNYDSPYTTGRFVAASGSGPISETNAEVWQHNWNGNETRPSNTIVDNQADMEIEFYYANNSTIGYTYSTSKRVWVNTKYYDGFRPSQAAGNFYHEWNHKLGYGHETNSSNYRPYTVPYAMGYMMRDHCGTLDAEYGY